MPLYRRASGRVSVLLPRAATIRSVATRAGLGAGGASKLKERARATSALCYTRADICNVGGPRRARETRETVEGTRRWGSVISHVISAHVRTSGVRISRDAILL